MFCKRFCFILTMKYYIFLCFSLISSFAVSQKADSLTFEKVKDQASVSFDLLDVPVPEKLNENVSVASKIEESNTEAPSSITAYTSKDINRLGYYTLEDLSSITSGYSATYQYGEAGFETRGQSVGGFNNNKHLLLIDGIPVNFSRSYKAHVMEELPLFFAQRVEFLKGPASALYGVSAFSGVINIVPKSYETTNTEHVENKISVGSRDNNRRWMSNVMLRNKWLDVQLSTGYYEKEASGAYLTDPPREDYRYWDRNQSVFMYWSTTLRQGPLKGLKQGLIYMYRKGGWGEMFFGDFSSEVNRLEWSNLTPYIQYKKNFSRRIEFSTHLKFNNSTEDGAYQPNNKNTKLNKSNALSIYKSSVVNTEFLGEVKYKFSEKSSLIIGLNYDWRKEQGNPQSYAYQVKWTGQQGSPFIYPISSDFYSASVDFNTVSGFAQYRTELNILKGLIVTMGLRQDYGFNKLFAYKQLSPRAALVQKITNHINFKLMTGRALRAPGIKEIGQNAQYMDEIGRNGFSDPGFFQVKPEAIQTYEAALVQTYKRTYLSLTAFYNQTTDEIINVGFSYIKDNDTIDGSWFKNRSGLIRAKGFEFDFKALVSKRWTGFYNFSYAQSRDQLGNELPNIPTIKTNMGITYTHSARYPFSVTSVVKHMSSFTNQSNGKVYSAVWLVDLNLYFPLVNNLSAELQVRNLLDDKSLLPSSAIKGPGRNFLVTVAMKF